MKTQKNNRFYGWYLVAALWLIYFINIGFPMYGGTVLNAYMIAELGISRTVLGLAFSLFSLTQGLPGPLISYMIARRGQRFTMTIGTVMIILSALIMAFGVHDALSFVLAFGVLGGIGVGFATVVPIQTTVTQWFDRQRSMALAITLTASGFGGFFAAPILTAVMNSWGSWRASWLLIAAASAVALILVLTLVCNKPADKGQLPDGGSASENKNRTQSCVYRTSETWTSKEALRSRAVWMIFLGALGFYVPYMMMVSHGLVHLLDMGVADSIASLSVGTITLASVAGRLLGGWAGEKAEPPLVLADSLLLMLAGSLFLFFGSGSFTTMAYAVCVGVGFGAAFVCIPNLLSNYFGVNAFAGIYGSLMPLLTVFSSLSPYLAGQIFDHSGSYTAAFIMIIGVNVLGLICTAFIRPPQRKNKKAART